MRRTLMTLGGALMLPAAASRADVDRRTLRGMNLHSPLSFPSVSEHHHGLEARWVLFVHCD